MSLSDDKWEKREARIRGSGTRDLKLDEFSIASPETTKNRPKRVLQTLGSALVNPEDHLRPRLRTQKRPEPSLRRENRKLAFSSDDDDDDDTNFAPGLLPKRPVQHIKKEEHLGSGITPEDGHMGLDFEPALDFEAEDEPIHGDVSADELPDEIPAVNSKRPFSALKQEDSDPLGSSADSKRRRGRPKKDEREKKVAVVTRRSRRIVDNPSLRQAHVPDPSAMLMAPKPLRALGLASLVPHNGGMGPAESLATSTATSTATASATATATSLGAKANGKQRGLVIDAERVYTPSTRTRRVNLNTLDVLQQFVEEHTPRPASNELVNENVVLTEFKAHLKYNLGHLMDLHASILDISQDISDVQRRKNDVRRSILELRKKHAEVGTELAKERKTFAEAKAGHQEFMAMANSLRSLKAAVMSGDTNTGGATDSATNSIINSGTSATLHDKLEEVSRIVHPKKGLSAQLRNINAGLSETIGRL